MPPAKKKAKVEEAPAKPMAPAKAKASKDSPAKKEKDPAAKPARKRPKKAAQPKPAADDDEDDDEEEPKPAENGDADAEGEPTPVDRLRTGPMIGGARRCSTMCGAGLVLVPRAGRRGGAPRVRGGGAAADGPRHDPREARARRVRVRGGHAAGRRRAPVYANAVAYNWDPANQCNIAAKAGLRAFEGSFAAALAGETKLPDEGGPRRRPRGRMVTEDDYLQGLREYIEGCGGDAAMVASWGVHTKQREGGTTAGTSDTYFVSAEGRKFRSLPEVARHFGLDPKGGSARASRWRRAARASRRPRRRRAPAPTTAATAAAAAAGMAAT